MDRGNGRKIQVVIPGTFDLLHQGHKCLLDYGKMIGEVIVTINGDKFSESLGKKTAQSEDIRKKAVEDYAKCKVYVVHSNAESLARTLQYAPCFRFTGDDWNLEKTSKRNGVGEDFWENNEVYLIYKDRVPNISSTQLRCDLQKE
jgi:cytidyltransferase-like protein